MIETLAKVIEQRDVTRDYGFAGTEAIIEHPTHGLLYVADGYGGEHTLQGGAVRWQHGIVIALLPGDTLASLTADEGWNEYTTILSAASNGYDKSRPLMVALKVQSLAAAAGLI